MQAAPDRGEINDLSLRQKVRPCERETDSYVGIQASKSCFPLGIGVGGLGVRKSIMGGDLKVGFPALVLLAAFALKGSFFNSYKALALSLNGISSKSHP